MPFYEGGGCEAISFQIFFRGTVVIIIVVMVCLHNVDKNLTGGRKIIDAREEGGFAVFLLGTDILSNNRSLQVLIGFASF